MSGSDWTDESWSRLVARIRQHRVTPVFGAGASLDVVGSADEIARKWAVDARYPLADAPTLSAVAQYVATTVDRGSAAEYIQQVMGDVLEDLVVSDIDDKYNPYRFLTAYDFPIWITTNYDDLIERGLRSRNKPPKTASSSWTPPEIVRDTTSDDLSGFDPSPDNPLVFHLHGRYGDDSSMVITEADYLEFLEQMANRDDVLPDVITTALASTSLLFIGYSFRDINLHLLLRNWRLPRRAIAVQPAPTTLSTEQLSSWANYYPQYLKSVTGASVTMFWGTASEFCASLDDYVKRNQT